MSEITFHDAYKLLSNQDKIKIINWQKCKRIYDKLEILIYNSKKSYDDIRQINPFFDIRPFNPFIKYYLKDNDRYFLTDNDRYFLKDKNFLNNDYIVQVKKDDILYVWAINDIDGDDFYDMNILNMINENQLFILCCQIFMYYYYKDNFNKFDSIYKFSFYYEIEGIQKLLTIKQKEQVKYNNKFIYLITLDENNKDIISSKKIRDYNHIIKYENDMCGLLVLFS